MSHAAIQLRLLMAALLLAVLLPTVAVAFNVPARAGDKYLEVLQPDGSYAPVFVKGMNLSVALPGKFPSQFPYDEELYRRWYTEISAMNCNAVRFYTLHNPEAYRALKWHNETYPDRALWLIQGIWASAPPERDYLDPGYMDRLEKEMRNAVDVVHGRAIIHPEPGHAEGKYDADVSPWLLAWLVGREWEPDDILGFHELRPDYTTYQGTNVSAYDAQPIECWMARICDYTVTYEEETYGLQHPVTFSSWPPTDPLTHLSESNLEFKDEMEMDKKQRRVDIFSNDAVHISSKEFTAEPHFKAGIYASYHVYTYYPDFIDNEPAYSAAYDRYGPSNYAGYLADLKAYYDDRPLLIAEYGLSNSLIPSHLQKQGWHHGGMTEAEVAEHLPRLTQAIYDEDCAGGVVFAWIDEWFKKVWMWTEMYDPFTDIRLWYNMLDAEQNFGMVALQPGMDRLKVKLSGSSTEWADATELGTGLVTGQIESVKVQHDEGWLYLRVKLKEFDDWDFSETGLCVALDVLDPGRGNFSLPAPLDVKSGNGLEVAMLFQNGHARLVQTDSFRLWTPYRVPYSVTPRLTAAEPYVLEAEDNPEAWVEPVVETNRRRVGRDGNVYQERIYPLNPMPRGSLQAGAEYNDLAVWNVDSVAGVLEIRWPWLLAGFVGPHQRRVLQADESGRNSSEVSEGVAVAVALFEPGGTPLALWPRAGDKVEPELAGRYTWQDWGPEGITYHSRLKPVYYEMQQKFAELETYIESQ